ncbi:MAG: hypothetical protein ACP5G8_04785 [Athalassotoga sp.]
MKEYLWTSESANEDFHRYLLIVFEGRVYPFEGKSILPFLVVKGYDTDNWTHATTYRILLNDNVRTFDIYGERFIDAIDSDTWEEVSEKLGVSIEESKRFLRSWMPKTSEYFDRVEREIEELKKSETANLEQ